jgi:hypothetical protein
VLEARVVGDRHSVACNSRRFGAKKINLDALFDGANPFEEAVVRASRKRKARRGGHRFEVQLISNQKGYA